MTSNQHPVHAESVDTVSEDEKDDGLGTVKADETFGPTAEPHHAPKGFGSSKRIPFWPNKAGRRRGVHYEQEYPPDEFGAEMAESARVWRVYLDEADEYDAEMVDGFKDTTDVLLVFAGLFSAVVSTFVSQSSQTLQPNYAQITASLITELVNVQRALASGQPVTDIPVSPLSIASATTDILDRWVNRLWFGSLTLSLVSALIAVLAKQWLLHYNSALSGTPRKRVLIRHFRFLGLAKWKVSSIIGLLPVLLHLALFMFLAGLVVFVWPQDQDTAVVVLTITSACCTFYVLSNVLGAVFPDCSYKSPVSDLLSYIWQAVRWISSIRIRLDNKSTRRRFRVFGRTMSLVPPSLPSAGARSVEIFAAEADMDVILLKALLWLRSASSNPVSRRIVYGAFGGLPFNYDVGQIPEDLKQEIKSQFSASNRVDPPGEISTHTHLMLRSLVSTRYKYPWHPLTLRVRSNRSLGPIVRALSVSLPSTDDELFNVLFELIPSGTQLPPILWKRIFERRFLNPPFHALCRLMAIFLDLLKDPRSRRGFVAETLPGTESPTNWSLPASIGLAELCQKEPQMINIFFDFIRYHLQVSDSTDRARETIDASRANSSPPVVHVLLSILVMLDDHLTRSRHDTTEMNASIEQFHAKDLVACSEKTLLSLPSHYHRRVEYVVAFLHCKRVQRLIDLDPSVLGSHHHWLPRIPASNLPAVIMFHLLEIVQHPWPLVRDPDIFWYNWSFVWGYLTTAFEAQDQVLFDVILNCDGLRLFRRIFPIDFRSSGFKFELANAFKHYVRFLSQPDVLDDSDKRRHLEIITQPENLAWLMWLSSASRDAGCIDDTPHAESSNTNMVRSLCALPLDMKSRSVGVDILVEELRRDAATVGIPHVRYSLMSEVIRHLDPSRPHKLYAYTSPSVELDSFQREQSLSFRRDYEGKYGPFPVYYMSPTSSPVRSLVQDVPTKQENNWYQRFGRCLGRNHAADDTEQRHEVV